MNRNTTSGAMRPVVTLRVDPRAETVYLRFWFVADLLGACVIVAFWSTALFWAIRFTGLVPSPRHDFVAASIGVGVVLFAGIGALVLRLLARRVYGMAEVLFALVVAWHTLSGGIASGGLETLLALASAVYLVVRGLDNWLQGVEARSRERRHKPPNQTPAPDGCAAGEA